MTHTQTQCRPHEWDLDELLAPTHEGTSDTLTCVRSGRRLAVVDTSLNMRASIAHGIASRLYEGDEYDEVRQRICDYFEHHLSRA